MALSISKMKQKMKEKQNVGGGANTSIFPFFKMNFGESCSFRFLPYPDPVTEGYWTERRLYKMHFVSPDDDGKQLLFKAPGIKTYDMAADCVFTQLLSPLYREAKEAKERGDANEEKLLSSIAGKHYFDLTAYYQGFVNKAPASLAEENPPANPIRIFPLSKQIHSTVYNDVFDNDTREFEFLPCGEFAEEDVKRLMTEDLDADDVEAIMNSLRGYAFVAKKTKQGDYAKWDNGSGFMYDVDMLTEEQIAAIAEYGFHDLRKNLPTRPTEQEYEVLKEMMEFSIDYAFGRNDGVWKREWEEFGFKPFGQRASGEEGSGSTTFKKSGGNLQEKLQSKLKAKTSDGDAKKSSAANVLAQLKNRGGVKKEEVVEETVEETEVDTADVSDEVELQGEELVEETNEEVVEETSETSKPKQNVQDLVARVRSQIRTKK